MQLRFQEGTDRFQLNGPDELTEIVGAGGRLEWARAERAVFAGRERQFVDLTFVGPDDRRVVILLVERIADPDPAYVFPARFAAAGAADLAALAEAVEGAAAQALGDAPWPASFLLGPDGPASLLAVPGLAPYAEVLPAIARARDVAPELKADGRALHLGGPDGWILGALPVAERVAVEASPRRREAAGALARGGFRALPADPLALDLGRGFDLVAATIEDPQWRDAEQLLDSVVRHLNRDGALLLTVPAPDRRPTLADETPDGRWSFEQLDAALRERFEDVAFFSQGGADLEAAAAARPGFDPAAATLCAVARRPARLRPACDVSVVVPVFDKIEYTEQCLRSLAANTGDAPSWEVIVVDNGSSDGTPETLARIAAEEPRLRVWRNETNLGFARACNQGARLARGRIVLFLNNDTEVHRGWLAPLVEELDAHPETGIVGARLLYADGTIQHAGVAIGRDQIPFHVHCRKAADDPLVLERRTFPIVTGACLAARTDEFLRRGLFDEVFVNGHEDIDLCLRFGRAGRAVVYRPDSVVTHHEMVSDGRLNHRERNLMRTTARWRDALVQDDFRYASRLADRPAVARPLSFALKIGPPTRTHSNWGDIFFAEGMAKALERAGHRCVVHYLNEWGKDDLDVDVTIHISGLSEYHPKPWNVNLLWMINHPGRHTKEELARYDSLLVASRPLARRLRREVDVPVIPFLQATDPEHFRPLPGVKPFFDVVFVGNNKGEGRLGMRQIVADLLPTTHRLGVWGACWDGLLPDGVWQGTFVPHEKLPEVYNLGRVALNDHQPEMRAEGFVNNRTFDAVACGATVVSDQVAGLSDVLAVHAYDNPRELKRIVDRALAEPERERERTARLRERVLAEFTFDRRVAELLEHLAALGPAFERARAAKASARRVIVEEKPLVSIMVATYNRRDFLPATLDSIRAQSYPNWELALVNDGGPSVADIVAAAGDERIHLIELERNRGKGHAINTAFAATKGPFLAYQDDDDTWRPDHLESLLLPLTAIPGIEFAYSGAVDVTYDQQEDGGWREVKRQLVCNRQVVGADLLYGNQIQGIVVAHRRELFERVGGMDESLRVLIDWDLWRRICSLTYPYHIGRPTADRTLRGFQRTTGTGHLTSLHKTDPALYAYQRLRVLRKPLPAPPDSPLHEKAAAFKRRGRQDFLVALAERDEGRGRLDRAAHWYERALAVGDVNVAVWRGLAMLHLKRQRPDEALPLFLLAADHHAATLQDFLYATLCCLAQGRGADALKVLDAAEKKAPQAVEAAGAIVDDYRAKARAMIGARVPA